MTAWIARQRYLIDFTLASLARRKAKNVGLLLVYTLIVFLLASVLLFSNALRHEAAQLLAGSPEVVLQRMVAGRHELIAPGTIERLGRIRGVQGSEGRLWGYYYDPVIKANYTLMVSPRESIAPGTLVVGAALAKARGLAAGSAISLRAYSGWLVGFKVARIMASDSELISADLMLMSEGDFRGFFEIAPGYFTDIALSVANPQEVRNVASKLAQQFPDSRTIVRDDILRTYEAIFNWREGIVLALASLSLLAFAILAWDKASGLSADEAREIGILKAIGWETGDLMAMKFWEGALISLASFVIGYVAAYLHVFRFSSALFAPVLKGWAVIYPRFELVPVIDGLEVATLFFFTVFPYAAATLIPVWRAAITDPDAVMR
jgi:ABC-type lipoprotein release transport system permease subunit